MPQIKRSPFIHLAILVVSLLVYWPALSGNWIFDKLYLDMAVLQPIFILVGFFGYPYYVRYIIRLFRQ